MFKRSGFRGSTNGRLSWSLMVVCHSTLRPVVPALCYSTSAETLRTIRDGEPRTSTSPFTHLWALSLSGAVWGVLNEALIGGGVNKRNDPTHGNGRSVRFLFSMIPVILVCYLLMWGFNCYAIYGLVLVWIEMFVCRYFVCLGWIWRVVLFLFVENAWPMSACVDACNW